MANLIHDMQYVPCNSALLAQETLFFSIKHDLARSCFQFGPKSATRATKSRDSFFLDFFSGGRGVTIFLRFPKAYQQNSSVPKRYSTDV